VSEITDYIKQKLAQVRLARFVGEMIWVLGMSIAIAGLFWEILQVTATGFLLLFGGMYLSVHFELQRLDYLHALEKRGHRRK
jgi:hypothetical protein